MWRGAGKPVPLPVQALDHATGYLHTMVTKFETVSNLSIDARSLYLLVCQDCMVELRGFEPPTSAGAGTRAIDRARFG